MTHQRSRCWAAVVILLSAVTACSEVPAEEAGVTGDPPAVVEPAEDSDGPSRITLTEQAATRLDISTTPVTTSSEPSASLEIPYSAVMYDSGGATWAYTELEPLVYVREPITVASIAGDIAMLTAGPEAGTLVVSVGAAELYGTELGVDH